MNSADCSAHLQHSPQPLEVLALEAPAGRQYAAHAHRRGQLLYATDGLLTVGTEDGEWVVPPQRAIWLPPDFPHRVSALTPVQVRSVFIEPGAHPALLLEAEVVAVSALLAALLDAALAQPEAVRRAHIDALLLDEIAAAPVLSLHIPLPQHAALAERCRQWLERPADAATLSDWADALAMHPRTLARLFQRQTGYTFGHWLREARLILSLTALARGTPVLTVALEHGYDSPSAFSAAFRRAFGAPPSHFLPPP